LRRQWVLVAPRAKDARGAAEERLAARRIAPIADEAGAAAAEAGARRQRHRQRQGERDAGIGDGPSLCQNILRSLDRARLIAGRIAG
jgi:hypothetical protein